MFFALPFFPEEASSVAGKVDLLYFYLIAVSAFFALLIFAFVFVFSIKYRRQSDLETPKAIHGNNSLELLWTIIPLIISMTMFGWGATLYFNNMRPPADALELFVVGKQWMWKIQHPDGAREINELHIPVNKAIRLKMTSEDVIHSFFIPDFRVKMDVVPGRYTSTWFKPIKTGRYHLFCTEYCGTSHAAMGGWVHVMEPDAYAKWLADTSSELKGIPSNANESVTSRGLRLFLQNRCDTCHNAGSYALGPDLTGIYGSDIKLSNGTSVRADDTYVRESILNPAAKLVAGYSALMPTYKNQVGEEDILAIIEYLKSLKGREPNAEQPAEVKPLKETL